MKRVKLVPIIATAAAGLVLTGGALVMANATEDDAATPDTSSESAVPKSDKKSEKMVEKGEKFRHQFGMGPMGGDFSDPEKLAAQIDRIPEAMRTDLADLLTAPEADRAKLIEEIINNAKSGGYGEELAQQIKQAEKMSAQFAERAKARWDALPESYKNDMEAARKLDRGERAAAMKKIVENAKAGKYGEELKKQYERFDRFGQHMQNKQGKGFKKS